MIIQRFPGTAQAMALMLAGSLLTLLSVGVPEVRAQGAAQVVIQNVPPVLSSPSLADQVQKFRQGFYPIQFIYTRPDFQETTFTFRFTVELDGARILEAESEPVRYGPGVYSYLSLDTPPAIVFPPLYELLNGLDPSLRQAFVEGGRFPEGTYALTLEALASDPFVSSVPGTVYFTVRYAEPPILFSPADGAMLAQAVPVFSWLPVMAPPGTSVEYDLLVVEVLPGQTPLQAIESNRAHVHQTVPTTTFHYTPDLLPLESGKTYAWHVVARDAGGILPFLNDGFSEINTFTYADPTRPAESVHLLASLTLEPGFATLSGLAELTVTEDPFAYTLDGMAQVDLWVDDQPVTLDVDVAALQVQKTGLDQPVVLGGRIRGSLRGLTLPLDDRTNALLELDEVTWEFGQGFQASGSLLVGGVQPVALAGHLRLMRTGVFGELSAVGHPLFVAGTDPVEIEVTRLAARFPEAQVSGVGRIRVLRQPTSCDVDPLILTEADVFADFDCLVDQRIPLVESYDAVELDVQRVVGQTQYNWADASTAYDVTLSGGLDMQMLSGPDCQAQLTLNLAHDAGVQVEQFVPACTGAPKVDLGIGEMGLSELELPRLAYQPDEGWDFELEVDVDLRLRFEPRDPAHPDDGGFRLPTIPGVRLDRDGIRFPEVSFEEPEMASVPPFRLGGFKIQPIRFHMAPQPFDWADWLGGGADDGSSASRPGSWAFDWDFDLEFDFDDEVAQDPEQPASGQGPDLVEDSQIFFKPGLNIPPCLQNGSIRVTNARFDAGRLSATIPTTLIPEPGCTIPFGPGFVLGEDYALNLRSLGGSLDGSVGVNGLQVEGGVMLTGDLTAGTPFACAAGSTTPLATTSLTLNQAGLLEGEIEDLAPSCPVRVGPYTARVTDARVSFAAGAGRQSARLDGEAVLTHRDEGSAGQPPQSLQTTGTIGIDLVEGEVDALQFVMEGPFTWGLPDADPVLRFRLDRAEVDLEGMLVDGVHEFLIGDASVDVHFERVRVGLEDPTIQSGRIRIDEAFGFALTIDPVHGSLAFDAVAPGTAVTANPALRFDLTGGVVIDSIGFHANGQAQASIHYGSYVLDSLVADYRNGFRMRFEPFGVQTGQVDFLLAEQRIAYLDAEGFHPDPNFFEMIVPERLPLPTEQVAYVVLKRDGQVLLDVNQREDGSVQLDTRPGAPLELVVPSLQGTKAAPPTLLVSFSGVVVDPLSFVPREGTIRANVPVGDPAFDLADLGLPLALQELGYGPVETDGIEIMSFFLDGTLRLFDEDVAGDHPIRLLVRSDRSVRGRIELANVAADIPLVPGEETVLLHLTSVFGEVDLSLVPGVPGTFQFDLSGDFRIDWDGDRAGSAGFDARFDQNGFVLARFEPAGDEPASDLDLGGIVFRIDRLKNLFIAYDRFTGFDFYAGLDFTVGFRSEDWQFVVPLRGVEVRPEGFVVPEQEVHRNSSPPLAADAFAVQDFTLQPLAVRVPPIDLTWAHVNRSTPLSVLPRFDLELTLPEYAVRAPEIASATLTLNDVGFTDGILTGTVAPYAFADPGARLPLGPAELNPPSLYVHQISGGFTRSDTPQGPQQGVDLQIDASLAHPEYLQSEASLPCDPISVRLGLAGRGVEGTVEGFRSCGKMEVGPLQLEVEEAVLGFAVTEEEQSAWMDGAVALWLPPVEDNMTPVAARGALQMDLATGAVTSGEIELTEPFRWALPSFERPVFDLVVNDGRFSSAGLLLQGAGDLVLDQGANVGVQLNDLLLGGPQFAIQQGNVQFHSSFAFDVHFTPPGTWYTVHPDAPFAGDDVFRLATTAAARIDRDGIRLSGSSTGSLRLAERGGTGGGDWPDLGLEFTDGFTLGLSFEAGVVPPVYVTDGRADFELNGARLAYLDANGFHLDPAGIGNLATDFVLPERLGLPSEDVAYLRLRGDDGQPLVGFARNEAAGTWSIQTEGAPVELVLAGMASGGAQPPRVGVEFNIEVDDALNLTGGSIGVDLSDQPLDLEAYLGIPIALTELSYAQGSPYRLSGAARVRLPESLGGIDVRIENLRFTENGLEQATFSAGTFTETNDPDLQPITSQSFGGDFTFHVNGARLCIGAQNAVRISGTIESPLLADEQGAHTRLFYTMSNDDGQWEAALEELPELPLGVARFQPEDVNQQPAFRVEANDQAFRVTLSGILRMEDVLGEDFAVTVGGLQIGTDGVQVTSVAAVGGQRLSLLDEVLTVGVESLEPGYADGVFSLTIDGWMQLAYMTANDENNAARITVDDLRVATDGSFSIGQGDVNLLASGPLTIIEDLISLTELRLGLQEQRLTLTVGGAAHVPAPLEGTADVLSTISLNEQGVVESAVISATVAFDAEYNNSTLEVGMGDFATLELTGVGLDLDLRSIEHTALYANANVYVEHRNDKVIHFGDMGDMRARPGLRYEHGDGLMWHVTSTASPQNPLFDFGAGFFGISIYSIATYDPREFGLEIGGSARLNVEGVEGSVGFSGMRIAMPTEQEPNPIRQWPDFTGARFTVMEIASLEVGAFEFIVAPTPAGVPVTITEGSDPDEVVERTVMVREYLNFSNTEGAALKISLTDAFAGGVEQVMLYRDVDDNVLLYIRDASLDLAGVGNLNVSLRYMQGPSGFSLLAAGGGNLTGLGGIAAAGKFALTGLNTGSPQLSVGVFVAVKSANAIPLIPQAPPVIGLTGVGGGIFFRPEAVDLEAVESAVSAMDPALGFILSQRGMPPTDASFAVMAYASFVLLGQGPVATKEGSIFLELTDQYVNLNAAGSYISQGAHLTGGLTATLNWANLSIEGRIAAQIGYQPALQGTGDLGFTIAINPSANRIDWIIDGGLEADILGIAADGNLMISPAGFYADLSINANYNLAIVSLNGDFFTKVWLIPDPSAPLESELGAFAEIELSAEVPGASVSATAQGTFITRGGQLSLYAMALAEVQVMFVGSAEIGIYADFRNGALYDAGILNEIDGAFADLLADAQAEAEAMNSQAQQARAAVEGAQQQFDPGLDDQTLAAAGQRFQELQSSGLGRLLSIGVAGVVSTYESYLFTPSSIGSIPSAWQWVNQSVIHADDRPSRQPVQSAEGRMTSAIHGATATSGAVIAQLQETQAQAIEWQRTGEVALQAIESPVQDSPSQHTMNQDGFALIATAPFGVNEQMAVQQRERAAALAEISTDFADLEPGYLQAIENANDNLLTLEALIEGGLLDQGNRFGVAIEAAEEFFAREAAYFWEVARWAEERRAELQARLGEIESAIDASVARYSSMGHSQAAQICTNYDVLPQCDERYSLATAVALQRRSAVLQLANAANRTAQLNALQDQMYGAANAGNDAGFRDAFRSTAREYWYEIHNNGLSAYRQTARSNAESVAGHRDEVVERLVMSHQGYTAALDSLFGVKARMTETLYGLIDTYLAARAARGLPMNTGSVSELRQRRTTLAQALEPPVIPSIQIAAQRLSAVRQQTQQIASIGGGSPGSLGSFSALRTSHHRPSYLHRADVQWTAIHPLGIVESSFDVRLTTAGLADRAASDERLRSIGERTRTTQWRFKAHDSNSSRIPRTHSVTVRVRGKAGYTATRVGIYESQVDSGNDPDWQLGTAPSAPPVEAIATDDTAPTRPVVTLDADYAFDGNAYWVPDRSRLRFTASSHDVESGVLGFEAGLGTSAAQFDLLERASLTGVRDQSGPETRVTATLTGLNLRPGPDANHLRVFARNGAAAYSPEARVVVKVDETDPVWRPAPSGRSSSDGLVTGSGINAPVREGASLPVGDVLAPSVVTSPLERSAAPSELPPASVTAPVLTPPSWFQPREARPNSLHFPANQTLAWRPAQDPESAIQQYEFIVHDGRNVFQSDFRQRERVRTTTETSVNLAVPFRDSVFVHVRAQNRAGRYSTIQVVAARSVDPTAPVHPRIAVEPRRDLVRVYLIQLGADFESGIARYEWSAGSTPGSTSFRGWQDNRFSLEDLSGPTTHSAPPYLVVPKSALPPAGRFYINVRAVNGQGMASAPVSVGPMAFDETPPVVDGLSVERAKNAIRVRVTGVGDAESGIRHIAYTLRNPHTRMSEGSGMLFEASGNPFEAIGTADHTALIPFEEGELDAFRSLNVQVHVVNGSDISRTLIETIALNPDAPLDPSPFDNLEAATRPTGTTARTTSSNVATESPLTSSRTRTLTESSGATTTLAGSTSLSAPTSSEDTIRLRTEPLFPAPQGVQAILATGGVRVTWNAVSGAAGYEVYRDDTGHGTFALVTAGTVGDFSYTDTAGRSGSLYYVRAVDGAGRPGAASEVVSVQTLPTRTVTVTGIRTIR